MTDADDVAVARTHVQRTRAQLEAWIAQADPDHVHRWLVTYCGGNHAVAPGQYRSSGGTIGWDNECACGARKHLGF